MFQFLSFMWASLSSSCLARKGIKEKLLLGDNPIFTLTVFVCSQDYATVVSCFIAFVSIKCQVEPLGRLGWSLYDLAVENRSFCAHENGCHFFTGECFYVYYFCRWLIDKLLRSRNLFNNFWASRSIRLIQITTDCSVFDRLLLCLHCLHMFACLMILFEDRSFKYAEAFSMQCWIIILVMCYSGKW